VTGSRVTKYYFAGSQRIAIRKNGTMSYMLADYLGSTVATTNTSGQLVSGQIYKAWGEVRYSLGTSPTKYTFTGQYSNVSEFELMFYNARWYDSSLGRFAQADMIVPSGIQGLDRYAYVNNSPINFIDPTGYLASQCQSYYCSSIWKNDDDSSNGSDNPLFECNFDCDLGDVEDASEEQRQEWFESLIYQSADYSCSDYSFHESSCEYSFTSEDQQELFDSFQTLLSAINTDQSNFIIELIKDLSDIPQIVSFLNWINNQENDNYFDSLVDFGDTINDTQRHHPEMKLIVTVNTATSLSGNPFSNPFYSIHYSASIFVWADTIGPRALGYPLGMIYLNPTEAFYFHP